MKKEGVFFAPHGSKQCASSKKRRCCHHASLNPINVSRHQRHRDETKLGAWAINSYPHKPKLKPLEAQRKNEQKKKTNDSGSDVGKAADRRCATKYMT